MITAVVPVELAAGTADNISYFQSFGFDRLALPYYLRKLNWVGYLKQVLMKVEGLSRFAAVILVAAYWLALPVLGKAYDIRLIEWKSFGVQFDVANVDAADVGVA